MMKYNSLLHVFLFGVWCMVSHAGKELEVEVVSKPDNCERETKQGDQLKMHYTGKLEDGTVFDSSIERNSPFDFQLGVGQVIQGWDKGLEGMCVGEKRKLTIPPNLGYGDKGAGDKIPGGATLIFDVELVDISEGPEPRNVFKEIDTNSDGQLSQEEVKIFYKNALKSNTKKVQDHYADEDNFQEYIDGIIARDDLNRDGVVTAKEYWKMRKVELEELKEEMEYEMEEEEEDRILREQRAERRRQRAEEEERRKQEKREERRKKKFEEKKLEMQKKRREEKRLKEEEELKSRQEL